MVSVAIHLVVLLLIYQVRSVEPRLPRYAATPLYVPAAESVPPAAPRPRKTAVLPVVAPPPPAVLAELPAFKPIPIPDRPAPPERPVTRTAPVSARQPVLPFPAPAPAAPPSPVFASALPATPSTGHATTARTGSFAGVPVTEAPAPAKLQVIGGTFGTVPADTPRRGDAPGAMLPAGFGAAGVTAADTRRGTSAGASNGFGAAGVTAANPRRGTSAGASNGFGAVAAAPSSQEPAAKPKTSGTAFIAAVTADPVRQPAADRQATAEPLEILYKPRPGYTEEARRARVEGDIVLEALFSAAGNLRVLRVVRGLGYGLEQNAIDAAAKIRFRPAKEDGHAVDTVAMVRISFQMAY